MAIRSISASRAAGSSRSVTSWQPAADTPALDAGGRLVAAGFVDSHVHLDKSCIGDRCRCERGDLAEAIARDRPRQGRASRPRTCTRGRSRTLERCILHGTTRMRTHVEVDPGIGLRGLEGVLPLVAEYRWAIDLEICVFPQEGPAQQSRAPRS